MKKIHPDAYGALIEALTTINWNKIPFQEDLRRRLREHPELLVLLDFTTTKRQTSAQLVKLLMDREADYRDFTIELMTDMARLDTFPNLVRQVDAEDLLALAREAVANLSKWVGRHAALAEEREQFSATLAAHREEGRRNRDFADVLQELIQEFLRLSQMENRSRPDESSNRFCIGSSPFSTLSQHSPTT
ncbi:hypothetical protein [Streptomyces sp. MnatMP-M17]|uniref:hypothetical protein n=2 Tax=unclassified Streptomyces TaxID=2593676 RepID=UPI000B856941|nr:hypothetical protein [Streptomyces sp. MnatMP-M17]